VCVFPFNSCHKKYAVFLTKTNLDSSITLRANALPAVFIPDELREYAMLNFAMNAPGQQPLTNVCNELSNGFFHIAVSEINNFMLRISDNCQWSGKI